MLGGLTNGEYIERFNREQEYGFGHGMTCGGGIHQTGSPNLVAVEREGEVILVCPLETCEYTQKFISEERSHGLDWWEDH